MLEGAKTICNIKTPLTYCNYNVTYTTLYSSHSRIPAMWATHIYVFDWTSITGIIKHSSRANITRLVMVELWPMIILDMRNNPTETPYALSKWGNGKHQERDRTPFELQKIGSTKFRLSFKCHKVNNIIDSPKLKKMIPGENYPFKVFIFNWNRFLSNLGMLPRRRGSYSNACRRALANALKVASIIWWEFLPASWDQPQFRKFCQKLKTGGAK